jgi:hypothetical protein
MFLPSAGAQTRNHSALLHADEAQRNCYFGQRKALIE